MAVGPGRRAARSALLVGTALVIVSPMLRDEPVDSLPLSTYPMFAPDRGSDARIPVVVGLTDAGEEVRLGPSEVADTDEVMLAAKSVSRALREGPVAADDLCADVASRVGDRGVVRVEVRTETYDVIARYTGDDPHRPTRVEVHTSCRVDR